jgi:DNA-binding NtrC family response regulator
MKETILIVEDQFIEADYLRLMLTKAGYVVIGIARSVSQAEEMIQKEIPGFILLDIFLKGKETGIDLATKLAERNIPFVYLSANSHEDVLNAAKATQPYGFIVKPFREKDLLVTLEIAKYRHEHSLETRYRREMDLQKKLKAIISEPGTWEQKLLKIGMALQPYIPFDYMAAGFNDIANPNFSGVSFLRIGFNEYQTIGIQELQVITGKSLTDLKELQVGHLNEEGPALYNNETFEAICSQPSLKKLFADTFQMKSHLALPLTLTAGRPFSLCLYSRRSDAYNMNQVALFERIQSALTNSIDSMLPNLQSHHRGNSTGQRDAGVPDNYDSPKGFEGIIGKSHLLLNIFDHIIQVASSNTSVLLLGESGTGKEKIADCIHNLSPRKGQPFIKVNCAALPATLIESELFGYEKGAFTGATDKRTGKFEKANKGTIFLDEIGEMPIELQVKLLRVLQEKEIERIGGQETIKTDVRIIAATNKNLEKEVAEGRFRLDLYYRLNVFPITLPPLRDRKEDIPALAYYFMNLFNHKAGRKIRGFSDEVLKKLMSYHWPGNIRELEHLIERSVLLEKGTMIENISLPITLKSMEETTTSEVPMKTIHENERDYIVAVLKKCNGRIWGPGAAAEVLNIPPSTLKSKMKKLGIKKEYIP